MPFVYDRETFSIIDEERGLVVKPGAGRGPNRAYHIFFEDCEYVRSTWSDERDIHFTFSKEKGPDGYRTRTVTLGDNPGYNLRLTLLKIAKGDRPWTQALEQMFRDAIYFKLKRRVGEENIGKIRVSFTIGLGRYTEEYVPKD